MADNIIIKITTEADLDAAQKQLQALTDKMKQQEKAARELSDQEKADAASIKEMVTERSKLNKALAENQRYYREEKQAKKDEVAATRQSIKELEKQVKAYKTLQGTSGTMVKQLRAMREELQRMEDIGEFGTEAFMNLAIAAAKLEDQIGDTQSRIRVLSSDTIGLDTAMSAADGLAGSFYVATSAAELLGSDMEGLQEAFYKVQAAMSVMQGIQQIANTLNKDSVLMVVAQTAAQKLKAKATAESAAVEAADTAATVANTAAKGAQTAATGAATAAQWSLNAAIAANPIGAIISLVLAAVAALGALAVGVGALIKRFSAAGRAQHAYEKDSKQLNKTLQDVAIMNDYYAQKIENNVKRVNDAQRKETNEAKKRNASDLEMLTLEKKYADERAKIYAENIPKALKKQNQAVLESKKALQEAQDVVNNTKGEKKRQKALEQLKEAQDKYNQAQDEYNALAQQQSDALQEAFDAEIALRDKIQEYRDRAQQANIDLMRGGAAKEIAQIKLNYKEQLKEVKGYTEEETKLRKALLKKQAKEIAAVRKKYAIEAKQTVIQEQKNYLDLLASSYSTEEMYEEQLNVARKIIKKEAQLKIDALDKDLLSTKEYAAQKYAIELERDAQIRELEEQEVLRLNENEKRKTEILLIEAEARANALTGKEDVEYQKAIWNDYYNTRKDQIQQNTAFEIAAINRSTDTEEVKEQKRTQIRAQAIAEREALEREAAEKTKEIDEEYIQLLQEKMQAIADTFSAVLDYMQQVSDLVFEAVSSNIQAQMDKLDEMYTTDAQEAKENANKKYISEKELADKKAALEQKQAKYKKAQALIDAAINTALAVTAAMPNWIAVGIAAAMGAAQIGIIAKKPLAQYAKGRKGEKGEYALVGEKGPELMYVPERASIVPNHYLGDMGAWSKFGVPALPNDMMSAAMLQQINIDYDRLGKAVAANIPQQKAVSVNVDRRGVTISDNGNRRTYLNHKYAGSWS